MKTPEKKLKKLKKSRLWPSVVRFVLALVLGCALICAELALFTSYVIETKFAQGYADAERIARSVEAKLAGDGPDALAEWALQSGEDLQLAVIDREERLLTSVGELTVDLSEKTTIDIGEEHEIFWDKDLAGAAKALREKDFRKDPRDKGLDESDLLLAMLTSRPAKDKLTDAVGSSDTGKVVMECAYWQSVPMKASQKRVLVKSGLTIYNSDLFFGIAIVAVSGALFLLVLTFQFISILSKIKSNRRMEKLLLLDGVTGSENYLGLTQAAAKVLSKRANAGKCYAAVDLSVLKYQNFCSMHGTEAGQRLVVHMDRILAKTLAKKEVCAHTGGGDFALFLAAEPGEAGREALLARVRGMLDALARGPVDENGQKLSTDVDYAKFTFQAGVYLIEQARRGEALDGAYVNAGIAKASLSPEEGNAVACFSQAMWEEQLWQHKVESTMQAALDSEEFQVYVQPKYDPNTDKLLGGEALVRWISPTEGMIPPGRFIPIFEKTGFVTKLDDYMISHVAKLQSQWLAQGRQIVPVSVNVSRAHFSKSDLAEHIRDLVDVWKVPHEYIEIELTESAFFDDKKMLLTTVRKLQEYGFDVSMDDFGAGYSSLNSLKDLPLNVLKIDADFFRGDDFGTRGKIVVSEVIALAKQLDMRIVAEGVEKEDQVSFLAQQDCDMIQGYYYAKPMPAEEYADRLEHE